MTVSIADIVKTSKNHARRYLETDKRLFITVDQALSYIREHFQCTPRRALAIEAGERGAKVCIVVDDQASAEKAVREFMVLKLYGDIGEFISITPQALSISELITKAYHDLLAALADSRKRASRTGR